MSDDMDSGPLRNTSTVTSARSVPNRVAAPAATTSLRAAPDGKRSSVKEALRLIQGARQASLPPRANITQQRFLDRVDDVMALLETTEQRDIAPTASS